ncbi:acid protease [Neolentinus lepideus HHB14362 ss-1]|uniref:Acid protease n=1 Tax=Neolentinus lepideus HHB14362 ss-1 TaxID=1314782 RepID=A0A165R7K0_9AGAM|nr:acid protease [Neolentinus lepideus HHB14362 ss-1]
MNSDHLSLLCCIFLGFLSRCADALRLDIHGRRLDLGIDNSLVRRGNIFGQSALNDSGDVQYTTNITLGGQQFSVLIDTGSSDLWVAGTGLNSTSTGKTSSVTYVKGAIQGPVEIAALDFAGYTVSNQAFILAQPSSDNSAGTGLIGLGPNNGSRVFETLGQVAQGDAVLDHLFRQNTSTPNFLSVLLGRSDDPSDPLPGDLTVGEILPGYENISSQPKLPVSRVSIFDTGDQHWQTLLDADGIVGSDGKTISVTTSVNTTSNNKQLTAVFDTGFSLPQVPAAVAEGIYGPVRGAKLQNISSLGEAWIVPCSAEINATFKFGGVSFPIHPLDLSLTGALDDPSQCLGTFQPISDNAVSPFYDMILGMAFLRNVYILIDFGDFVDDSASAVANPYIQLLSTTNDTAEAHNDFVRVRIDGESASSSKTSSASHRRTIALAAGIALVALGFLLGAYSLFTRRRRARTSAPAGMWNRNSYAPLGTPAPPMALEVVSGPPPPPSYNAGHYYNPYDGPQSQPYGRPYGT